MRVRVRARVRARDRINLRGGGDEAHARIGCAVALGEAQRRERAWDSGTGTG